MRRSLFRVVRKQLAFMLGRQQVFLELEDGECEDGDDLVDIMSNVHLNNSFLALAREVSSSSLPPPPSSPSLPPPPPLSLPPSFPPPSPPSLL